MAILDDLGIEVTVQIDGTNVPEYDDPEPSLDHVGDPAYTAVSHKYIESEDDCDYAFRCAVTDKQKWFKSSSGHALTFRVYVDGFDRSGSVLKRCTYRDSLIIPGVRSMTSSGPVLRNFRFTSVNTVDDANAKKVKDDIKRSLDLGRIRVVIIRSVTLGRQDVPVQTLDQDGCSLTIAEKALKGKAISHGTQLSNASRIAPYRNHIGTKLDTPERPLAIFNFNYRSKDALRNEMIVPRSPSPSLSIDGLSAEDVQRLARERLAEIKNESKPAVKRAVKREFDEVFDLTEEAADDSPRRPLKIRRNRRGQETIDLAED